MLGSKAVEARFNGALILDVDGVLTDGYARPSRKAIQQLDILLRQGMGVALVTGRSRYWLEQKIIPPLVASLSAAVRDFWCAAEYGMVRSSGLPPTGWVFASNDRLPDRLLDALRVQSQLPEWTDDLMWDSTKDFVATVEIRHADNDNARVRRARLAALDRYQDLANRLADGAPVEIVRTSYAVDILPAGLSKAVGANWAISEMLAVGAISGPVWVLGDSPGDASMMEAVSASGISDCRFCWLGDADPPHIAGLVVRPSVPFAQGTAEFLDCFIAARGENHGNS